MTTRINLLPWRTWAQRRRRQHFVLALALAFVIGVAVVYWASLMAGGAVAAQQARNTYLRQQVAGLNRKIRTINTLKKARKRLVGRMRTIEKLERNRPLVVHLFDQLAATAPNDVYLTRIRNSGGRLTIEGVADSPAGVSTYMRNIAASPWLAPPNLRVVRTSRKGGTQRSSFSVTSKVLSPDEAEGEAGAEGGS